MHTVSTSFLPNSDNNRTFARYFITMKAKLLLIVSLFLLLSQMLVAQEQDTVKRKKTRIIIEHYDVATFSKSMGDMQRLIGNVKMRHDSAYFFCDSAHFFQKTNSFKAFQNVHIIVNDSVEVFSDLLDYDGNTRFAEFFDNVKLMDDSTTLLTEYMTYDRNMHLACYPDSATTYRGDKTLISCIGYYRDDIKEFSFFENVEVLSPKYQMYTDTLFYNTAIEKMWFEGPTTIINKENILEGEHGYYLVDEDIAFCVAEMAHVREEDANCLGKQHLRLCGIGACAGTVDEVLPRHVEDDSLLAENAAPVDGHVHRQLSLSLASRKEGDKVAASAANGDRLLHCDDGSVATRR